MANGQGYTNLVSVINKAKDLATQLKALITQQQETIKQQQDLIAQLQSGQGDSDADIQSAADALNGVIEDVESVVPVAPGA